MNPKLVRVIATAILLTGAVLIEHTMDLPVWQLLLVYLIPYLLISYDVIAEAWEGLVKGNLCNEDFLMCIATIGALSIGFLPDTDTEFTEAVFVMLFFQVGELFEDYAEGKSQRAITHLMEIRPEVAHVVREGKEQDVAPDTVAVGETVVVKPGEKIPLDGKVLEGESSLNTVALTGESMPRKVKTGDEIVSGCVNISGLLKIRVEKTFGESTASKIIDLVKNAGAHKSRSETFIAKFAKVYTPVVVCVALVLAFLPPFFHASYAEGFSVWLSRALTFLVVSCPCALVISVPLSFFGGIGGASRKGILIKGASFMDSLARLGTVVFDKTGTLTKGRFEMNAVHPDHCDANRLLHLAAHVERYSTHPIAMSLRTAYPKEQDGCLVEDVEEVAGQGVRALVNGERVCVGNTKMMDASGAKWHPCHRAGTIVHVAIDGVYAGHIVVSDSLKPDAFEAVRNLKRLGVEKTLMLTGDRKEVAARVAKEVGMDAFEAELLPQDKLRILEKELHTHKKTVAFVGDGINDAPALARADVGIAMGGLGSGAAIEAADVVLMDDRLTKIPLAVRIARRTIHIARENVWFAIGVKLLVLALAGFGMATMWMAVFADVGVTVLAVLNAMRTLNVPKTEK